ncbi:MAG: hypothetical protein PHS14_15045, partial [Elusimicrobia bacterium]|nr:hypothetical protein [Elusimicrobiota bacterium]
MISLAFASLFAFSAPVFAAAPAKGYVVKTLGTQIWLDLTAADGAAPGRGFTVYEEGEDIKHPVTGEQLGKAERKLAEGKIEEVAEKFSVGRLSEPAPHVQAGQRARLTAVVAAPAAPAAPPASIHPGEAALRAPRTRGASLPFVITAMAVADFDGAGKPQIVLSDEKAFRL